jgi:serine phosphatase RsbU (regulator of sigma subunit)
MEREDLMSLLEVSRSLISERSLEGLLELINTTATRIADCERGTVYLIDRDRGELWSRVKHGEEVGEIRLPVGKGIAGTVAATGEVVNITDAYGDPRFDGGWDGRTGYQTRTVLCLPMVNRQGTRIGVIQLLNKRLGHFSDYDVSVLTALSANAAVAFETAWLLEEMVEKKRMEEGLRIAREIQQGLLPPGPPDADGGLDIAFRNIPCDETGGDYVDVFETPGGRLAMVMGDVSGHGIGAALLMATGRAFLRAFTEMHEDPSGLLGRVNALLLEDTDPTRYMTLWFGILDPASGELEYASAGHDEPVLVSGGGDWRTLENTGVPLGMLPGMSYGPSAKLALGRGDMLVLTTDGLWEQVNAGGEPMGKEVLAEHLSRLRESPAKEVVDGILDVVEGYRGPAVQDDDYTVMVIRYTNG